jgi:hypothetical protein
MPFEEPTEFEGSEVDIPHPIVNFFEADIGSYANVWDVDPSMVPPDAPIGADRAHLEAVGILKRWQFVRHLPGGGGIAGGGGAHVEHLVRPLAVELFTEALILALLSTRVRVGERVVSAFSVRCMRSWRPFCCGLPGSMHLGRMPRRLHQAESWESRPRVWVAKGTLLSVRMRLGEPNALNKRVNTGLASAAQVEERAWQPRRKRLELSATVSGSQ